MAKRKSQPKKKNHIGLIIAIIVTTIVVLAVGISLLIFKPWNSLSASGSKDGDPVINSYSDFEKADPIKIDKEFAEKIENHKYQSIKSGKSFILNNHVGSRFDSDGSYQINIPKDWTTEDYGDKPDQDSVTLYPKEIPRDIVLGQDATLSSRIHFGTRPIHDDDNDGTKTSDPESILDVMIEESGSYDPAKAIDKFEKKINGVEYQVAVVAVGTEKHPRLKVIYTRSLDTGSLKTSILVADIEVGTETAKEFEKEVILDRIYSLENTLGSFDESTAKTTKSTDKTID